MFFRNSPGLKAVCSYFVFRRRDDAQADFPWEEGFKWPWEKTEKAKEAAVKVESPETAADELPEPAPESDAARAGDPEMQTRAGDPQMRAGSPQMMVSGGACPGTESI